MGRKMNSGSSILRINQSDEEFNAIYPRRIRKLAEKHFTPISIARDAAEFLVRASRTKVLDIGSGAGKFCMVGAAHTRAHFTGIEQRAALVELSRDLALSHQLNNVTFLNGNVTTINFKNYDAFYLYNPFHENIETRDSMDDTVLLSPSLYSAYLLYTLDQLSALAKGTRLATYYTSRLIVPSGFKLCDSKYEGHLDLWEKES